VEEIALTARLWSARQDTPTLAAIPVNVLAGMIWLGA
jgi:hypothetical protein